MFDNIGRKIKILAMVLCWLGIVLSILVGILMMIADESTGGVSMKTVGGLVNSWVVRGLKFIIIGVLSSWIGSFLLYGFGELIERTAEIAQNTRGNSGDGWKN